MKSELYYEVYAKRCELIGWIIEDLALSATANGKYEQFHLQRVGIFEFLEQDSLTLMDLREYWQTTEFYELLKLFDLLPGQ
ncbi:MAG: hypothetical protein EOO61_05590 [Hymenobacter sp.]|nr:MAG: hypothetical protein EOO61_05590 [Hymenobacter sp.]